MGSVGNQNPWAPYDTYKDCSQGICSIYCPQWCYIIFPPPPPFIIDDHDGDSSPDFSPLIIAVIGILASAFILVSYYTIISKYCRRPSNSENSFSYDENRDQVESSWQGGAGGGLEESVIKSITVCKYKKGDGFVDSTDCSVCLLEFQENDSLRLLPKCSHAFHVSCIDTWLKSHASCPLCRSHIAPATSTAFPPPHPPPLPQQPPPPQPRIQEPQQASSHSNRTVVSAMECRHRVNDAVVVIQDLNRSEGDHEQAVVTVVDDQISKPRVEYNVTDIRDDVDDDDDYGIQPIRRSVSLNYSSYAGRYQMSIADILRISEDDNDDEIRDLEKNRNGILNLVRSPLAMRRSISTGRSFLFTRYEKGKTPILPN